MLTAPGLGSPVPHLGRDWAHFATIMCAGLGQTLHTTNRPPGRVMGHVAHCVQEAFEDWDVPCEKCGDRAFPDDNPILLCDGPGPPV
jgi:hypothetical protein